MHTEVLWVAGEEQGAEQPGFGQGIKNGLSKPLRNLVWYLPPVDGSRTIPTS